MASRQIYQDVVTAARAFKSYAAELYVRRLISRIAVPAADLTPAQIPALVAEAESTRAAEFNKDGLDAFIAALKAIEHGPTVGPAEAKPGS
ncbi:MAG: hypothetical protein HY903_17680 [Deltaproteobacteria bacterium]|nr:hypothetical protein [Deltaproteobacteria bacterium]